MARLKGSNGEPVLKEEVVGNITIEEAIEIAERLGVDHTKAASFTINAGSPNCTVTAEVIVEENGNETADDE